jgi:hypothetical protein
LKFVNPYSLNLIFEWCAKNIGKSLFYSDFPRIIYYINKKGSFGEFCTEENIIYIYLKSHRSLRELVDTFLHEYFHYMQDPEYLDSFEPEDAENPAEIEVCSKASFYGGKCWSEVLKKLKLIDLDNVT